MFSNFRNAVFLEHLPVNASANVWMLHSKISSNLLITRYHLVFSSVPSSKYFASFMFEKKYALIYQVVVFMFFFELETIRNIWRLIFNLIIYQLPFQASVAITWKPPHQFIVIYSNLLYIYQEVVRLHHLRSGDSKGQGKFLASSGDKQNCNYDTECSG